MGDIGSYVAFIFATTVGLGLSIATYFIARKAGLAPIQAQLIDTLQDNATALTTRVTQLETEVHRERTDRLALQAEVIRLRDALADLAAENADLRKKLGMIAR